MLIQILRYLKNLFMRPKEPAVPRYAGYLQNGLGLVVFNYTGQDLKLIEEMPSVVRVFPPFEAKDHAEAVYLCIRDLAPVPKTEASLDCIRQVFENKDLMVLSEEYTKIIDSYTNPEEPPQ